VSADALALLDRLPEVDVETRSARGAVHRVPIWVVAVDGAPYVASVRGPRGRWHRELLAAPSREGTLVAGRRRIRVRAVPVGDEDVVARVSAAYARKYARSVASLAAMQRPEVLATTLRLELLG
jgi:hypothetical protein